MLCFYIQNPSNNVIIIGDFDSKKFIKVGFLLEDIIITYLLKIPQIFYNSKDRLGGHWHFEYVKLDCVR